MEPKVTELRTPEKNLLVGKIENQNDRVFLLIKSRGKSDRIDINVLISLLQKASNM